MKIAPVADVKARLSHFLDLVIDGPVIVTKNGRPTAIISSIPEDEDELERFILAHTPKFRRLLDSAYKRIKTTGGIEHDDFWKAVEKRTKEKR